MAVEPLEALGEVLDDLLRDWREALPQDVVEPLLVQLVRELRASQLQQGPPQDGIPGGTQAVEGVVNRCTVSLTVGVQGPGPADGCLRGELRGKLLGAQRLGAGPSDGKVNADAGGGGEVVGAGLAVAGALDQRADGEVLAGAVGQAPAELDPGAAALAGAGAGLVEADEPQVHAPVPAAEGRQPGRVRSASSR